MASEANRQNSDHPQAEREGAAAGRLPYSRPHLEVLGDVRDLTLGGTPGLGDSSNPLNFQAPTKK